MTATRERAGHRRRPRLRRAHPHRLARAVRRHGRSSPRSSSASERLRRADAAAARAAGRWRTSLVALAPGRVRDSIRAAATYLVLAYAVLVVLAWTDPRPSCCCSRSTRRRSCSSPRRESIVATVVLTAVFTLVLIAHGRLDRARPSPGAGSWPWATSRSPSSSACSSTASCARARSARSCSRSSTPPATSSRPSSARPARAPSASGSRARSTTRSPRGSPAS